MTYDVVLDLSTSAPFSLENDGGGDAGRCGGVVLVSFSEK